jgi:hypothetical protein
MLATPNIDFIRASSINNAVLEGNKTSRTRQAQEKSWGKKKHQHLLTGMAKSRTQALA